jgi:hypothetical protein
VPDRRLSILVALACLGLLLVTEPQMAIVWDEGYTLGRVDRLRLWFRAMADPAEFSAEWIPPQTELVQQKGLAPPAARLGSRWNLLFDARTIGWFWPFAREEPHGHPPFYALVALIGDVLTSWREPLQRARFGTMAFHALACALLFSAIRKRFGTLAAAVSAVSWAASPHVFGLAHYATYDGLLNSLWLMGLLVIAEATDEHDQGVRRTRLFALAGLILGAAMATKLSGWFLVVPYATALVLFGFRKSNVRGFLVTGLVALVALYAFNPPWWCEPIEGPLRFFRSNLSRAQTIPIETLFLGKVYETPIDSLPWWNSLLLTAMTVPALTLSAAMIGGVAGLRSREHRRFVALLMVGWAVPTGLRALPQAPGHDGVRQFVAALGVIAALSGIGVTLIGTRWRKTASAFAALAIIETLAAIMIMHPVPLSYFSPIVGGLPGAARLGMEPTYYWDGLTGEALDWLNANTLPGEKIAFKGFPTSFLYLNQVGRLKPSVDPRAPGRYRWMAYQNRPGNYDDVDRAVVHELKPAYTYEKLGVPLVSIYSIEDYEAVRNRLKPPSAQPQP